MSFYSRPFPRALQISASAFVIVSAAYGAARAVYDMGGGGWSLVAGFAAFSAAILLCDRPPDG